MDIDLGFDNSVVFIRNSLNNLLNYYSQITLMKHIVLSSPSQSGARNNF
jgi:hypothetical protein